MIDESVENPPNQSVENNINEYYRLKSKYDNDNDKNKKKILNNKMLGMKEKKAEFKQLKPKCVNCGRPGGTTFASVISKDNSGAKFRELRAFCKATEPCGLNINIAVGNFENINDILKMIDGEIYTAKNEIITDKNKLLFGLITTEKALENFDLQKATIKDYTDLLEIDDNYNILTTTEGWQFMPFQGQTKPEPMTADDVKTGQDELDIQDEFITYKQLGKKIENLGKDDVDGTECFKLKMIDKDGKETTYYLDPSNYFVIKETAKITANGKEMENSSTYSNYKKTENGVFIAMNIGGGFGDMEITKIEINPKIDESIFKIAK